MLGSVLRYLQLHPGRVVRELKRDPGGLWDALQEKIVQSREYRRPAPQHQAMADWESRLHRHMGVAWPCQAAAEFRQLWHAVITEVQAMGIDVGPASFNGFNDGDAGLVRAIWCLIRHLKPANVVETGVARGFTSRFILEALERNGSGRLSSIDLPPLDPAMQKQIGMAVGDRFSERWTLISGSSRRYLPGLLSRLGKIDLFIHDSRHTERNVRFELDRAWAALRAGGALVVDDIDSNWGFQSFTQAFSGLSSLVCEAEPIRPDFRRLNEKGLFAIILKAPR